jgi:DNA-binding transcriptional regulator YdaS (Cro superfamily)
MEKLIAWLDGERGRRLVLACALDINPGAISQWTRVPAERVLDVERLTGVSRHVLRPDIFGPAAREDAA